jgi:hypothetical protein
VEDVALGLGIGLVQTFFKNADETQRDCAVGCVSAA